MLVVDVETTGTDPSRHSIISIGAIDLLKPERQFFRECRVWDGAEMSPEALEVNGCTPAQVTDPARPTLEQVMGEFIAWCKDAESRVLMGHNTSFDRDFLQTSADRYGLAWRFGHRVLDLHSFCWMHMLQQGVQPPLRNGKSAISADESFVYTGLPPEPKPHHGMTGAPMEAEAFARLLWGRMLLPQYEQYPLTPHVSGAKKDQSSLF